MKFKFPNKILHEYDLKFNIEVDENNVVNKEYLIIIQELKTKYKIFYHDHQKQQTLLAGLCKRTKNNIKDKENLDNEIDLVENTLKLEAILGLINN
jgi:hypothetical protein